MFQAPIRRLQALIVALVGFTGAAAQTATPALPASTVATDAVRDALAQNTPSQNSAQQAAQNQAAQNRAAGVAATQASDVVAVTPIRGKSVIARSTAYNSTPGQTDATPFITATGTRTRPGVIALSRDLLRIFPYGTRVMIEDLSGRYSSMLKNRVFIVEDTMAARKTNSVDVWMPTRSEALNWGARQIRITAIR